MFVAMHNYPDSKVHGANTEPTWVLSAPDGPHVGPMNLAIRVHECCMAFNKGKGLNPLIPEIALWVIELGQHWFKQTLEFLSQCHCFKCSHTHCNLMIVWATLKCLSATKSYNGIYITKWWATWSRKENFFKHSNFGLPIKVILWHWPEGIATWNIS